MSEEGFSIEIGSPSGAGYKSIRHLKWVDIPPLSILTGRNGSGKSQLLEFMALRLTDAARYQNPLAHAVAFKTAGVAFAPDQVVYIPSNWSLGGVPAVSLAEMRDARTNHPQQILQNAHGDINHQRRRAKLLRLLGPAVNLQPHERQTVLKDDFSFLIDEANVSAALCHIFMAFRLKVLRELEAGLTEKDALLKHGRPPWETLNEVLKVAEFEYSVNSPVGVDLLDYYIVRLTSKSGEIVTPSDLSSGEQTILQVVLWLYYSQHHGEFPKLMLLDEPDAHLHPAMTRQFLAVLHEVLVKRYGVRIILATHSPSTVALAPEGSIFEMKRAGEVQASPSKQHAIGLLTSGLLTVGEGTRFCFVEDHDDVKFYSVVRDLLSDFGPSRDPGSIAPAPSIVFLPVSAGKGSGKVPGGCKVVLEWVSRFSGSGLSDAFRGVIDWDGKNEAADGVLVLSRYSFENYLLDPISIYVALLDTSRSISVEGVRVTIGEEHLLKSLTPHSLQMLADVVIAKIRSTLSSLRAEDEELVDVAFTHGFSLKYPRWMLETRGKDLLSKAREAFGGANLTLDTLLTALKRTRLIPQDLSTLLKQLQQSG